MIRGIIMDVDGTLLDSMAIWDEAGERYLAQFGIIPEEGFRDIVYPMTTEESAAYMKSRYELAKTGEEIRQGVLDVIRDFYYDRVMLKEGASELLEAVRKLGIPMAAATSSEREHIEHAFDRLGILDRFRFILTCSEVGAGKTSPEIYLQAADKLGFGPQEILVAEDALYCLRTAKNAGFVTAGVRDESSASDWEEICETADFTLEGTERAETIRERIERCR